jgi:hypothetical protein
VRIDPGTLAIARVAGILDSMMRLLAGTFVGLLGCSTGPGDADAVASSPLSGTMVGAPWTFQMGELHPSQRTPLGNVVARLFQSAYTQCSNDLPATPSLELIFPLQTGDFVLGRSYGVGVAFLGIPCVGIHCGQIDVKTPTASEARIVIDVLTETKATGGVRARYNDNNEVNGRFELAVCPSP